MKIDTGVGHSVMSEEHSADEMDETGRTAAVNRRNFVKALGVTGALGFSGMSSAQAQSADEDKIKREITTITGSAHREYISMALSDADVSTITKILSKMVGKLIGQKPP